MWVVPKSTEQRLLSQTGHADIVLYLFLIRNAELYRNHCFALALHSSEACQEAIQRSVRMEEM